MRREMVESTPEVLAGLGKALSADGQWSETVGGRTLGLERCRVLPRLRLIDGVSEDGDVRDVEQMRQDRLCGAKETSGW